MKNFMMLFIAVFLSAATLLPLNGNEGKKKSFPACSFSTKLEMNFPADTAFLLLYLEESSYNMQETKARIDAKEKQFLEALKKEYPSVKYTSSTESIGTAMVTSSLALGLRLSNTRKKGTMHSISTSIAVTL